MALSIKAAGYLPGGGGGAAPAPGAKGPAAPLVGALPPYWGWPPIGAGAPPPVIRASSCRLRSSVIESPLYIIRWLAMCLMRIGFFGIAEVVLAGAMAGALFAGGDAGVIGALVCANAGAAIANTAAIATPFKRCFMLLVLCGSSGFDICGNGVLYLGGDFAASGRKQPACRFVPTNAQPFVYRVSEPVGAR
jgi:hypothetical protein